MRSPKHPIQSAYQFWGTSLYNLPESGKWQVMVTTHSPAFIDLSRDNTTVVRVERDASSAIIRGTTVFRPEKANLSSDEKEELKMLNLCDPHLCEFFFGGRTIVVEGDTEYTAFKYAIEVSDDETLRDVHVVRARGKSTICLIAKILNHVQARYAVLHDSDCPTVKRRKRKDGGRGEIRNPAWTNNLKIHAAVGDGVRSKRVRLLALIPNFEGAFLGEDRTDEKPAHAWAMMKQDEDVCRKVTSLLRALLDHDEVIPAECVEWEEEADLLRHWSAWQNSSRNRKL